MSQEVQVEGVGAVSFPDDATKEEILDFLNRQHAPDVSAARAFGEHAAVGVAPGAAFMAGFPVGAKLGSRFGPIGAGVGGIISGTIASTIASKAQTEALKAVAPETKERLQKELAAGEEQHPIASIAGEVVAPGASAKLAPFKMAQLPLRAGLAATVAAVQPIVTQGRLPNLKDIVAGTATGALYGEPRSLIAKAAPILPRAAQAATEAIAEQPKPTEEIPSASEVSKTTEVHGDVRPQPVESQGQVPVEKGGEGVQPQAQAPQPEVVLTPPKNYGQQLAEEVQAFRKKEEAEFLARQAGTTPKPTKTFPKLVKELGRDKVVDMLAEYDPDAKLSPDGKYFTTFSDPRNQTGKMRGSSRDFLTWVEQQKQATPPTEAVPEEGQARVLLKQEEAKFSEVADYQRGEPEAAMREIQKPQISQIYGFLAEHVGDLTHRMSEHITRLRGGGENVASKVRRTLRELKSGYGIERDIQEQIESNLQYYKERGQKLSETHQTQLEKLKQLGQQYADAHRQIPVFNDAQRLAQSAAIAIGEFRFKDARDALEQIDSYIKDKTWEKRAMEPPPTTPEPPATEQVAPVAATPPPIPPELTGMGGALAEGEIPQGTALKNATGELERLGLGLPEAYPTVRHKMAAAWIKAGDVAAKDPTAGKKLADDLIANPERGMTDEQSALLLRHKVDMFNAMNAAAEKTHVGTDAERARAALDHERLSAEYTQLLDAIKFRGSEWGREGRWRRALAREDYSFSSTDDMNRFHRARTGRDLTPEQKAQAEKQAKPVKESSDAEATANQAMRDHIRAKAPRRTDAEKAALDAAWKTVREAAARMAEGENKKRVETTVREIETAKAQEGASSKALSDSVDNARDAAIKLANAENTSRVAKSVTEKAQSNVQIKAAQKAMDAANKAVAQAAAATAKEARRRLADPSIAVWEKAREYLDKGVDNFDDIRTKIATDLGMDVKKVTRLIAQDKRGKYLADDLWKKQQDARRLKEQAKRWLTNLEVPMYEKALQSVPRILFGLKVGFHGTVALGTHAPSVAFQPRFWKVYVQDFGKMYKMVGSKAYYETQVQDLMRRPNYIKARRAGLVNDPFQYEDYNSPDTAKYFGNLSGMGNRGYTVLKILRQDMFDQMWNRLPRTAQMPEIAEAIANGLNHATGVVKGKAPRGTNIALFAPRLEASRVAWLAVDPAKAAKTFLDWKNATPGDKAFAINQVKEKAWVAGTLFSMLALNQGFLSAIGSKQKVNFDDPFRSDFLKFKVAGMNVSYGNAMITMARLPVQLYRIRSKEGGKTRNLIYPDEDTYSQLGKYVRSQLSPFAGLLTELWLKADYANRPLPSSTRPVPKRLRAQGIEPYTWPEFWSEQLTPIPVQEALKEVWQTGMGMSPEQVKQMTKAMATIAVMGATGARLSDDTEAQ